MKKLPYYLIILCFCSGHGIKERTFFSLGTVCTIKAEISQEGLLDSAVARCLRIDQKFSYYDSSSTLSLLNRKGQIVDSEFAQLIAKAKDVGSLTEGGYDITCQPLLEIWGFYNDNHTVPEAQQIEVIKQKVDFRKIAIVGDTVMLNGTHIDLGSIIHGYAADQIAQFFKENGIRKALIDIGGEIVAYGKRWQIGIKHPRKDTIIKVISLNGSIATSGDYENFFIDDSIRFHHIIDARTGYPAKGVIATTVIGRDCTSADILATALFIAGPEKGVDIAKRSGVEALWIDADQKIITTKGFYR